MRNIGVLTYHRSINYGAFLQAHSLSSVIAERTGYCAQIFDYEPAAIRGLYLRELLLSRSDPFGIARRIKRYRVFRDAQKRLPLAGPALVTDDYRRAFGAMRRRFGAVVVGSDVVWNWTSRGFPNLYLLHEDVGCPKLSYAASAHGLDFGQITSEQAKYLSEALRGYAYIGVRDTETERFVRGLDPSLTVHRNCDPTVYLELKGDNERLRELVHREYGFRLDRPCIGLMSGDRGLGKRVREWYGKTHQIVAVYMNNPYADCYLYALDPLEWAGVFSLCDLVFSQCFHGVMLALKNETPVIAVDFSSYSTKYCGKMQDLLRRIGFDDWYYHGSLMSDDDWDCVRAKARRLSEEPPRGEMRDAIRAEAASGDSFFRALSAVIDAQ